MSQRPQKHKHTSPVARPDEAAPPPDGARSAASVWARVEAVSYWGVGFLFAVQYWRVHSFAGFAFPAPWTDEASFMWQALAFARHNWLFVPQVDPDRSFFWGGPGYMVLTGTVFKFLNFSLARARLFSELFALGGFFLLAWLLARYRFRVLSLLFCGAFLLSGPTVACGNLSRMETLMLLVVCGGALLLQRNLEYGGLALWLLAPLVHPNGVYFLPFGVGYIVLSGRFRQRGVRLERIEWTLCLAAVLFWSAFALYVVLHLPDVQYYLTLSLQRKFARDIWAQVFGGGNARFIVIAALCALYLLVTKGDTLILLALAIPAWLCYAIGHEMWYQMFNHLSYALLSIALLHIATDLVSRLTVFQPLQPATAGIVTAVLLSWNYQAGRIAPLGDYPWSLMWGGMRVMRDCTYIAESEIATVRRLLDSLRSSSRPLRVSFYPEADSLFFHDQEGGAVRFLEPPMGGGAADVRILHTSRCLPTWMRQQAQSLLNGAEGDGPGRTQLLVQGERTDSWFYRITDSAAATVGGNVPRTRE